MANQRKHVNKLVTLRRFSEAWQFCEALGENDVWRNVGEAAIADLNVDFGE